VRNHVRNASTLRRICPIRSGMPAVTVMTTKVTTPPSEAAHHHHRGGQAPGHVLPCQPRHRRCRQSGQQQRDRHWHQHSRQLDRDEPHHRQAAGDHQQTPEHGGPDAQPYGTAERTSSVARIPCCANGSLLFMGLSDLSRPEDPGMSVGTR
jgi:hypothetical protein